MCLLIVIFIFKFFQASLYAFYAVRAQMVTAKLSSIQVCMCSIEPVFFKDAAEERLYAAEQSGPQCFFPLVEFHVSSV